MPKDVAFSAENAGVIKANLDVFSTFMLALLAGAFIGFGAIFSTTVMTGNGLDGAIKLPFGIMRLIGGSVFCLGLILVTVAGAEMFTGNVLLVMAAASRKITLGRLLRNWGIVFAGNFVGAVLTALMVFFSGQFNLFNGQVGLTALTIAETKCSLGFIEAGTRAIFCNVLVCLAIWLSLSGRTVIDKVVTILFPITAFVTSGFEHSVANMYFISFALWVKHFAGPEFWNHIGTSADAFSHLTVNQFLLGNLLPVTLGNTVGGLMVGLMYWGIYCRPNIMMREDDEELLNQLTHGGRRKNTRVDIAGMATVHVNGLTFRGKLRNLSMEGLMIELNEQTGLPSVSQRIEVDLQASDSQWSLKGLRVQVINRKAAKNLMGRTFFYFSLRVIDPTEEEQAALRQIVEP